jgi:glycosyltransferase involved in cell wall biosynthesis
VQTGDAGTTAVPRDDRLVPGLALHRDSGRPLSMGFVGTYPPTKCGIATFTASLARAMAPRGSHHRIGVVSCVDEPGVVRQPPEVVAELVPGLSSSQEAAAAELDSFDAVVIQHEFGIFGGEDGSEVIDLVAQLRAPPIVVLHTALVRPLPNQRAIVEQLSESAEFIVAQSVAARTCLLRAHTIDPERVRVIPHGAPANIAARSPLREASRPPIVLTWGLIGPSKGIEFGIEAVARLRELGLAPRYVVLGQTHPRIILTHGEAYRESLIARAYELGVDDLVEFDDCYGDTASLLARVREADVVLLPYRSRDQVVSGVLVEAVASGKPVVATRFPHAEELLGQGSGILVPHEDSTAIAAALHAFFTDPELAASVAAVARRQAPSLFWTNVGHAYRRLAATVASARAGAAH